MTEFLFVLGAYVLYLLTPPRWRREAGFYFFAITALLVLAAAVYSLSTTGTLPGWATYDAYAQ